MSWLAIALVASSASAADEPTLGSAIELSLVHGIGGATAGALGASELFWDSPIAVSTPMIFLSGSAGGLLGFVLTLELSDRAMRPSRAMAVEDAELLGIGLGALIEAATLDPVLAWSIGAPVTLGAGMAAGALVPAFDPDIHATYRILMPWGLYYADASFGLVPVQDGGDGRVIRYIAGPVIGAGVATALRPVHVPRWRSNAISAGGVGGVLAATAVPLDRESARGWAVNAFPLVGAGLVFGLTAPLARSSVRARSAGIRMMPDWTVDQGRIRPGLRLGGAW